MQYAAALAFAALISFGFETREVNWTPEFTLALSWMVGGLSIGAISLYYLLLRREASQTASLFFLVPGVTAIMAALMFGEEITALEIVGVGAAMLGVRLVTLKAQAPSSSASR